MSGIPSSQYFPINPNPIPVLYQLPAIYTRIAHFLIGCWILEVNSEQKRKEVQALHIHSVVAEII